MSIVGNIECKGPAQVFGRIEAEVRASDRQIGEGARAGEPAAAARARRRGGRMKLHLAAGAAALPAPGGQSPEKLSSKRKPNRLMIEVDTAIGPQERIPRRMRAP